MKTKIVMLCGALILCSLVIAQSEQEDATLIKVGASMPPFTVKTLDGTTVDSRDFKGKVVLLNFWAT